MVNKSTAEGDDTIRSTASLGKRKQRSRLEKGITGCDKGLMLPTVANFVGSRDDPHGRSRIAACMQSKIRDVSITE